jgi:hypothetical protein
LQIVVLSRFNFKHRKQARLMVSAAAPAGIMHVGCGKDMNACRVDVGKEIGAKTYRPREMDTCRIRAVPCRDGDPHPVPAVAGPISVVQYNQFS